jgi:hypothetical protein
MAHKWQQLPQKATITSKNNKSLPGDIAIYKFYRIIDTSSRTK